MRKGLIMEQLVNNEQGSFFDNPFMTKILDRDQVAKLLKTSVVTVDRLVSEKKLPVHYVGNKPRFFLEEVWRAFTSDCLDRRSKSNDKGNEKQGWNHSLSSVRESTRAKSLSELSQSQGGLVVD